MTDGPASREAPASKNSEGGREVPGLHGHRVMSSKNKKAQSGPYYLTYMSPLCQNVAKIKIYILNHIPIMFSAGHNCNQRKMHFSRIWLSYILLQPCPIHISASYVLTAKTTQHWGHYQHELHSKHYFSTSEHVQ